MIFSLFLVVEIIVNFSKNRVNSYDTIIKVYFIKIDINVNYDTIAKKVLG
ncbi:hypothetical protein [Arcobacter sp.]